MSVSQALGNTKGVQTPFITFPLHLVAIPRFPGYVYHLLEKQLYSYKSGYLKPIKKQTVTATSYKFHRSGRFLPGEQYFSISHQGHKINLRVEWLEKRLQLKSSVVPYKDNEHHI